jgi:hypothetical protein
MGSILQDLQGYQQADANIQATTAEAALRNAQVQQIQQAATVAQANRQASRAAAQAQMNAPETVGGTAPPTPPGGVNSNADVSAINDNITQLNEDYTNQSNLASQLRIAGGDPNLAAKADEQARQSQAALATEQLRLLDTKKNVIQQAGSVAQAATADNWVQSKQQLDSLIPGWDKNADVDFDPLHGGQTTYGARTAKVLDALGKQAQTSYQQTQVAHAAAEDIHQSAELDRQKASDAVRATQVDQDNALSRARVADLARKAEATANPKPAKIPEPKVSEINDLAPDLATDNGLPLKSATVMAGDILRRRNELQSQNPGMSVEDATDQANEEAKARVQQGVKTPFYSMVPNTPPSYNRVGKSTATPVTATTSTGNTPDAEAQTTNVLGPLARMGVAAKMMNGQVTAQDGSPLKITSKAQALALPKGTRFIGPDGQSHTRI